MISLETKYLLRPFAPPGDNLHRFDILYLRSLCLIFNLFCTSPYLNFSCTSHQKYIYASFMYTNVGITCDFPSPSSLQKIRHFYGTNWETIWNKLRNHREKIEFFPELKLSWQICLICQILSKL